MAAWPKKGFEVNRKNIFCFQNSKQDVSLWLMVIKLNIYYLAARNYPAWKYANFIAPDKTIKKLSDTSSTKLTKALNPSAFDPRGRPTVKAGSDHCLMHMSSLRPSVRLSPLFKTKQMFATDETVGLAKWIIDDSCLAFTIFYEREM